MMADDFALVNSVGSEGVQKWPIRRGVERPKIHPDHS
jgi:hypothetical protein